MPKKVDHRSRRADIAEAVWLLMARGGIEEVTMRRVARQARMSLGQLQHYFASKETLLDHAFELMTERVVARTSTREDPEPDEYPSSRTVVRRALVEMLPLDEERTIDAHVWVAFLARASTAPELAVLLRKIHAELQGFIIEELRRGQRDGSTPVHLDPSREARTLLAVLDGLIVHALIGHHTPAEAEHALDNHLDMLFSDG
jgi:TetR/AcrR family transcriptional repressor of bet genes